jgi:phosphatidylserine decarboxylase
MQQDHPGDLSFAGASSTGPTNLKRGRKFLFAKSNVYVEGWEMPVTPIQYYDRYARALKTERIYGEKWLRFAYENPAGGFFVWALARRAFFSKWYGWKMNKRTSALQILPFITTYNLDVDEFAKSPFDYKTFNEFFFRALKPEARPISPGEGVGVFPADGRHLAFPDVDSADGFYLKGKKFPLTELFGEESLPDEQRELSRKFAGGSMLISRLCPVDYHRFHFPISGIPGEAKMINGWLYSVSPVALRRNVRRLVENKRQLTLIDSAAFGSVAMLEIGATNVGSIMQTYVPGRAVKKGEEKGLFAFGGSCVVTIFQRGKIRFDADIVAQSEQWIETYARMGDRLGLAP